MARPKSITDDEINEAAREVFLAHGPSAPVKLIAKKLGVSHAALFARSGSKEQLMLDALCPGQPRALEWLAQDPPHADTRARLIAILLDLMRFLQQVVPNLVILKAAGRATSDLPEGSTPPPVALRAALSCWLERAIEQGAIDAVATAPVAEGLLGAMEARCFNGYLGGEAFAPGEDEAFINELVAGLLSFGGEH